MKLFGRKVVATVGTLEIKDLDMTFTVKRTLKPEPNTLDLVIYNLNPDHRKELQSLLPKKKKIVPVKLEAGYAAGMQTLFLGEVRSMQSQIDGADVKTSLSTGDSATALKISRINKAFAPATPTSQVLKEIVGALGIGQGNIAKAVTLLQQNGVALLHPKGAVLAGNAAAELTALCKSANLEWSVQDGALQVLDLNGVLEGTALELGPDSGLVESPSVDNKGVVSATLLMIPDVKPGIKVVFNTESFKGGYRITQVETSGSTFGQEWYHKIQAEKY